MSAQVFRLPDLGEGLTEAAVVNWLVAVGDEIVVDQPIVEVETAKSVVEVPSPFAGTVAALHGAAGDVLAVGAPLLEVGTAALDTPDTTELEAYRAEERAGSGNVLIGYGTTETAAGGRTRKRRGAAVPAKREHVAAPAGPVAVRSPIVRRLAQERGVDLRSVTPTGSDGAVTRADVERALSQAAAPASGSAVSGSAAGVVRTEPLSMLRKAVGAKMSASRREIPEATVWVDVDVTELWELRRAVPAPAPSFSAIIGRFVIAALAKYPVLGARLSADGLSIEHLDGVHLGFATDTERGLLVPVVRNAEKLGIAGLDAAIRSTGDAARAGTAAPAELTGSTFTINNYGTLGVDGSAAIINHPEVAILGIGRMIERPWVHEGQIVPRRIATVSLVFDHRVCDGGYAAGFLNTVVEAMEHPLLFTLSL
ncbi:MAG TPA: dihydrolipoamide acetyltransferase family protein [Pseudolysinimonas sp.]|nr:dihydrolipoamide acetyltransferase family protein [Pseudolysinimonas sp.]